MIRTSAAAALAASLFAMPAQAGLVIDMEEQGKPSTTKLEGKRLRIERSDEHGHVMIFDGEARRFLQLDPAARTYSELHEEDGKAVGARLQAMLAQLPPEQRARAEAAMAAREAKPAAPRHEVTYQATGRGDTIAGFRCEGYRVLRDGKSDEEGCFIPWSAGAARKEDLASLAEMGRFLRGFAANMGVGQHERSLHLDEEIQRAPGFPALLERIEANGTRHTVHRLTALKRTSVGADAFAVPAGYARVKSPALFGAE